MIRTMTIEDYEKVYALWKKIHGFGLRSIDDSREGIEKFLKRNPTTSVVAVEDGNIVGAILCGHDGRRGCLYHVCVDEAYRRHGIGKAMVVQSMEALKAEGISNVSLIAFTKNDIGNAFWNTIGWNERQDLNYYDFVLNTENITAFNAISNVSLIAFTKNDIGNAFWNTIGWNERQDLNYYDFVLNTENITAFNAQ